jgi:hypothetical protein
MLSYQPSLLQQLPQPQQSHHLHPHQAPLQQQLLPLQPPQQRPWLLRLHAHALGWLLAQLELRLHLLAEVCHWLQNEHCHWLLLLRLQLLLVALQAVALLLPVGAVLETRP